MILDFEIRIFSRTCGTEFNQASINIQIFIDNLKRNPKSIPHVRDEIRYYSNSEIPNFSHNLFKFGT